MDELEEGEVFFTPEEVEQIVNWAIGTGAMLHLMHDADAPDTVGEAVERVHMDIHAVENMFHQMPEALLPVAEKVAEGTVRNFEEVETQVAEFMEQIEDL